ncbi:MAG: UDP-glucose 4-epimerase [Polyangiales bacterium]|jgi:UDP-glucose 4-epimerase
MVRAANPLALCVANAKRSGMATISKVLISGASGFIGRRLRRQLLDAGTEVVAIRRNGSPPTAEGRSTVASYADTDSLRRVVAEEQPEVILHVAGVTKGRSYADFERGNVMPTKNLLEAATESSSLKRFVLISSLAAYGPSSRQRPLVESDERRPVEFYGQSKRAAEEVVESSEVPWTIMRPSGVYGPGDVDYLELFRMAEKRLNVFFGNRERAFSAIYVDDCIRAIIDGAAHANTISQGYFLTDDVPTTWGEFQAKVVKASNKRALSLNLPEGIVTLAAHAGELASRVDGKARLLNRQKAKMSQQDAWLCSGAKARSDFGFEASVSQDEGVQRTRTWYRDNGQI